LGKHFELVLTDTYDAEKIKILSHKLMDFNTARSGFSLDHHALTIYVTDPVTDELIGGLWGSTAYLALHIELVYLPEELRGSGLGRQLMEQAEQEAIHRGCHLSWLDTFTFQARGFYERLGYTVFGTLDDYPPGHSRFFLRKNLPTRKIAL
jgi:GNAT superfamily N-acetyltransferase